MPVHPFLQSMKLQAVNFVASVAVVWNIFNHVYSHSIYIPYDWFGIATFFTTLVIAPCVLMLLAALPLILAQIASQNQLTRFLAIFFSLLLLVSPFSLAIISKSSLTFVSPAISVFTLIWSIAVIMCAYFFDAPQARKAY